MTATAPGLAGVPLSLTPLNRKDFTSDQEVRWCPGCGDYAVLAAFQGLMPQLGIKRENTVIVSGIVAVTLSPIMSAMLAPKAGKEGRMARLVNAVMDRLRLGYGRLQGHSGGRHDLRPYPCHGGASRDQPPLRSEPFPHRPSA